MSKLWIIIGVPGSGKTTLAEKIAEEDPRHPMIFEADMYFMDEEGNYNWNPEKLNKAHQWCFDHVEAELRAGFSVIVSNTSLTKRERKPYIDLGKAYNAEIEVITCTSNFKNVHGVPKEKLEQMKKKFQKFDEDELN